MSTQTPQGKDAPGAFFFIVPACLGWYNGGDAKSKEEVVVMQADLGLIGLAVMGQNLVLNMERRGFTVAVYNRTYQKTEEFLAQHPDKKLMGAQTLEQLVGQLSRPRRVMLMVKAGAPVDGMIDSLTPLLSPGDVIVDGGNSFYEDTVRRSRRLEAMGIHYLGAGVSGGEEGALLGPSIMPGGSQAAWDLMRDILTAISAEVAGGERCCDYIGPDGAGHFVKTTHNGIEYGDMQLICEAYFLMERLLHMQPAQMAEVFESWNEGDLDSYLIEITGRILRRADPDTGKPLVDVILDEAGQKGTGMWTTQVALAKGVPTPTVGEAVFARCLSAHRALRLEAAQALAGPQATFEGDAEQFLEDIHQALYASKVCAYAQGFDLMAQASEDHGWNLDLGNIAMLWRGGCIIRAQFLSRIKEAYDRNSNLTNLMLDPYFASVLEASGGGWRRVVAEAVRCGVPLPCFASALTYYDGCRTARLPANLLQAQRDYFGAHTYRRLDKDGVYHTQWLEEEV